MGNGEEGSFVQMLKGYSPYTLNMSKPLQTHPSLNHRESHRQIKRNLNQSNLKNERKI